MFYISKAADYFNIQVTDTSDGSVEVYDIETVQKFLNSGIYIAGVDNEGRCSELNSKNCWQYYIGDYQGAGYDAYFYSNGNHRNKESFLL